MKDKIDGSKIISSIIPEECFKRLTVTEIEEGEILKPRKEVIKNEK